MLLKVIKDCHKAIFLRAQCYAFASTNDQLPIEKIDISPSAQKALWASKYISHIKNAEPRKEITDKSLREQLLAIEEPTPLFQFEEQITQEMRAYFEQGVDIDSKIFSQGRIVFGKQVEDGVRTKFIFWPSVTITKPIFKYLTQNELNFLITGGLGIGKTASIVLFVLLSNDVNRYFYQAKTSEFHKGQLEKLKQNGLLCEEIPRYWYWSVEKNQTANPQFLQKMVLSQTFQISQEVKEQLQKLVTPLHFLREFNANYPLDVTKGVIVDQINAIASMMRQYNSIINTSINLSPFDHLDNLELKNQAQLLRHTLSSFIKLGDVYAFNSSTSIERELLKTNNENSKKLSLNLEGHQILDKKRIQYSKQIETKAGKIEFWQAFWFQFERNLPRRVSAQNIKKMQQLFYQQVKDEKVNQFSNFLFIREYLADKSIVQKYVKAFEDIESNNATGEKKNPFQNIAQDFATVSSLKKFGKFHQKDNDKQLPSDFFM